MRDVIYKRIGKPLCVMFAVFCGPLAAEVSDEATPETPLEPDMRVMAILDAAELNYEIDDDQDFRLFYDIDDGERSQTVWVRSATNTRFDTEIREVWSYIYRHPTTRLPPDLMLRMLRDSFERIMGSWALDDQLLLYVVRVPVGDDMMLIDALSDAAVVADALEKDILGTDEF